MLPLASRSGSCWRSQGPRIAQTISSVIGSKMAMVPISRNESSSRPAVASGSLLRAGAVEDLDRVGVQVVAGTLLDVPGHRVEQPRIGRAQQAVDQPDLLQLAPVRRQDRDVVVDARRLQMRVLRQVVLADLLGEHEDAAVRRHRQVVVDVAEILPEDVVVPVVLDQAVAPGRVADRDVERQQVAIGIEVGLLDVDVASRAAGS